MKFDEKIKEILNEGESYIKYLQKLDKSPNIDIENIDVVHDLDEIVFTVKKFPIKNIDTYGGEYDWEEALEADIEQNYEDYLTVEYIQGKTVTFAYYLDYGIEALKRFIKDYKIK